MQRTEPPGWSGDFRVSDSGGFAGLNPGGVSPISRCGRSAKKGLVSQMAARSNFWMRAGRNWIACPDALVWMGLTLPGGW